MLDCYKNRLQDSDYPVREDYYDFDEPLTKSTL